MSYTKKDYFEPGAASGFNSVRGDYKSQSFEALSTYTIDRVVIKLWSSSSKTTLYYVRLYDADGTGLPTGGVLATFGSFTLTSLQSSANEEIFDSGSYEVTNGNDYCIVCESADDPDDTWNWYATSGNDYATGNAASKTYGNDWIARTYDFWFQLWEEDASAPTKATNPSPADAATSVDFSALGLSWDDGGGADTYNIYMGPVGNLSLISSAQAGTTLTVDTGDVPWGERIYWRIDSTNAGGTTTGDTWYFDNVIIRSVKLGADGSFIVVAAKDGVYLSADSGANWTRKTPDSTEDTDWVGGICSDDGTYIITVSSANAIYRSANSGTAWAAITPAGGDTFSVNDLATSDDGQFMVIVGQNSTTAAKSCYISTDYGATWTVNYPVAGDITYTECDISNDGAVIAVATTANFYISLDSGATWLEQGMASSAEVWAGLSISGDGTSGIVANTNNNDEVFVGVKTTSYSEATWAESSLTSAGRAILDDADAAAQAVTLGLEIGVDTQAWDAQLDDIAALAVTNGNFMVGDGSNWVVENGDTARVSLGVGTTDSPVFAGITTTGTIDASAGKVLVTDNDTSEPSGESDGYIGVSIIDGTARVYFTVSGTMYYVDGTVVAAAEIVTGNPIGLLLALTYNLE